MIVPEALRSISARSFSHTPSPDGVEPDNLIEQATQFAEIASLLQSGRKNEAIARYHEITGVALDKAEDAVDALEAGRAVTLVASSPAAGENAGQFMYANQTSPQSTPEIVQVDPGLLKRIAAGIGTGVGCITVLLFTFILAVTIIPIIFALAQPGAPFFETWSRVNPLANRRLALSFGQEGSGPGYFQDPRSITFDRDGNLYVADFTTGRIQQFNPAGDYQSLWIIENKPYIRAIVGSLNNEIYVIHDGRVFIYDGPTGRLTGEVTLPDDVDTYVKDMAISADGSIVLVSSGEHLYRLDSSGQVSLDIPDAVSGISGDSELDVRVAVDGLGNIFLLGTFNNAVFKYSAAGNYLTRFGGSGDEPGQIRAASAIGVDSKGRVYVSDSKGIQVFDNEGRFLELMKIDGHAFGIALDDKDNLYLVTNKPRVNKYSLQIP